MMNTIWFSFACNQPIQISYAALYNSLFTVLNFAGHHYHRFQQSIVGVLEVLPVQQKSVKAQGEGHQEDEEHVGDCKEGGHDVGEEDDKLPHAVQEPHVDEKVDPGEGDRDGAGLPFHAGPDFAGGAEVVDGDVHCEGVDDEVQDKGDRKLWFLPIELYVLEDRGVFSIVEEEDNSEEVEDKDEDAEHHV